MNPIQNSFKGGMDLVSSDMDMSEDSYRWLMNGRQRYGEISANNKAVRITTVPAGKKQGLIGVGNVLLLFVNGKAYWNEDGSDIWTNIASFSMSTREMYYLQSIPASTFNFTRKLATTANIKDPLNISVDLSVAGTPSGILVQDGIHQPFIVFYDYINKTFTARVTGNYADWSLANPEYVPIGKKMFVVDQILFIESPDEQSTYRCVSGMPLNFMLNIDTDGNKQATEAQGGAATTSIAFDFDKITNLSPVNIPSSFMYATARNTRVITLDYTNTIFGEPRAYVSAIIDAGIVNHYSLVEINGDYAFVDAEGVKTFNAVKQLKWEGRNSNFSVQLSKLLKYATGKPIKQINPIAFNFNNYSIFALQSTMGFLYFVYDSLSDKWVAFDSMDCGRVTRTTTIETSLETKLYAINIADELWQLYANGQSKETAMLMTRSFSSIAKDTINEIPLSVVHKSEQLKVAIENGTSVGTISAFEYVDKQLSSVRLDLVLSPTVSGINYPVTPPVIPNNKKLKEHKTFAWRDGLQGRKLQYLIKWNTDAVLSELQLTTTESDLQNSVPQSKQPIESTYGS